MPNSTFKAHYEHLKQTDYNAYKQFNAALAAEDQLQYWQRSVVKKGATPTLFSLPSWIRTCMVRFMGFTHEQFDNNTMPDVPTPADAVA